MKTLDLVAEAQAAFAVWNDARLDRLLAHGIERATVAAFWLGLAEIEVDAAGLHYQPCGGTGRAALLLPVYDDWRTLEGLHEIVAVDLDSGEHWLRCGVRDALGDPSFHDRVHVSFGVPDWLRLWQRRRLEAAALLGPIPAPGAQGVCLLSDRVDAEALFRGCATLLTASARDGRRLEERLQRDRRNRRAREGALPMVGVASLKVAA